MFVIGVGMTKFEKPGGKVRVDPVCMWLCYAACGVYPCEVGRVRGDTVSASKARVRGDTVSGIESSPAAPSTWLQDWDYPDMARIAATRALNDACIDYSAIQQVCVGYCYGDSTCGQRAVYQLGMTGVPVYNVNNNCATGSTALYMAKQFVEGGLSECCMALGALPWQAAGLDCGCPWHPPDLHVSCYPHRRLREDGEGQPRCQVLRPHQPHGPAHGADDGLA